MTTGFSLGARAFLTREGLQDTGIVSDVSRVTERVLLKLPENRGLWITYARYLTNDGKPIHEHGLPPSVAVEQPAVPFGDAPPAADDALMKALERLKTKKGA